jgi:hypothetical protein
LTGIDHYQLQYATNSSFSGAITIDVYDTSYQVPNSLSDTIYYWRVKAVDFGNNWSDWSSVWQFEIDTRIPLTPSLLEPINGVWRNTSNIIFSWMQVTTQKTENKLFEKEDNFGDNVLLFNAPVYYILQLDSNHNITLPIITDTTNLSSETINLSEGRFFWRVRAFDYAGNQSSYSVIDSFGLDITAPTIPILSAPDSGLFTNTQTVSFKWFRSSDNLSKVKYYKLQYSTSSTFINAITLDSISDTTATSLSLGDSVYFWRVQAKDKAGNFSNWSRTRSLRIYTQIPSMPVLIAPQNNLLTNNSNVNFAWHRSTSPIINYYIIQYARNAQFANPDSSMRYDTTLTLTFLDSTYYWRVRAIDSAGNISNWSAVWSFEIDTRTPNIPSLISPINGVWLFNNPTIFNWSQVNLGKVRSTRQDLPEFASAVRYILQVDTNRNFTNSVFDTTGLIYDTLILNQARYFWRVGAYDLAGNQGTFSGYDSFGIDYTAPTIPNLIAPVNNVTFTDSFVQFYWNRSLDNVSGVINYRIQIAFNSNFTFPTDLTFNDTTLLITLDDTTYFWRVKAIDRANNESNWSAVRSFRVLTAGIQEQNSNELINFSFHIYPNPSRTRFSTKLSLPHQSVVRLVIYDKTGKLVRTLINEPKQNGDYLIYWNCRDDLDKKVSPGIYFYILETCGKSIRHKVTLLK